MPGMYTAPDDFDLAGFAVGAMERGQSPCLPMLPKVMSCWASRATVFTRTGILWCVASSKSAVWAGRRIAPGARAPSARPFWPRTQLYVKGAVRAAKAGALKGLAHITGGGLTENLPRVLPAGLGADVDLASWTLPPVFRWLAETGGIAEAELLKTFNSGHRHGCRCDGREHSFRRSPRLFQEDGHRTQVIGKVVEGAGVTYRGQLL